MTYAPSPTAAMLVGVNETVLSNPDEYLQNLQQSTNGERADVVIAGKTVPAVVTHVPAANGGEEWHIVVNKIQDGQQLYVDAKGNSRDECLAALSIISAF